MRTFYTNRAGSDLSASQRRVLTKSKMALRRLYGRDETARQKKIVKGKKSQELINCSFLAHRLPSTKLNKSTGVL
jgi:hypothetical protein